MRSWEADKIAAAEIAQMVVNIMNVFSQQHSMPRNIDCASIRKLDIVTSFGGFHCK